LDLSLSLNVLLRKKKKKNLAICLLEIKGGNPLKISGKGGTSGKNRRKKS
jgi:hypothetical protein